MWYHSYVTHLHDKFPFLSPLQVMYSMSPVIKFQLTESVFQFVVENKIPSYDLGVMKFNHGKNEDLTKQDTVGQINLASGRSVVKKWSFSVLLITNFLWL